MKLVIVLFISSMLLSCSDYSKEKEVITESPPAGRIDSLTNDTIKTLQLPDNN